MAGPGDKFQPILCAREGSKRQARRATQQIRDTVRGWNLILVFPVDFCARTASRLGLRPDDDVATEFGARLGGLVW